MKKVVFHMALLCFISGCMHAQAQGDVIHEIKVLTRSYGDSIVIRWAPTSPISWKLLNRYGYRIERYTLVRDSIIVSGQEKIDLNTTAIKPAGEAIWSPLVDKDDYAAIAAQAIYGEGFEVSAGQASMMEIAQQSSELESRFSFALFAADYSPLVARLSGLRWVDTKIKRNERYLYRVYPLVPEEQLKIAFGYAYQAGKKSNPLPEPQPVQATPGDRTVRLEWETVTMQDNYTGYYLERSEDEGVSWQHVSKFPVISVANSGVISLSDSMVNNKSYSYRIQGTNPFGEVGPHSKPTLVVGIELLKGNGAITNYSLRNNIVSLIWRYEGDSKGLKGFDVERASRETGPYQVMNKNTLESSKRNFDDVEPLSTNYYRLITIGDAGQRLTSVPYLVQLADSIPPAAPVSVVVKMDTSGIVRLSWQPNQEKDIEGYLVFRSHFKNSEFTRVNNDPLPNTSLIDTISVSSLSRKLYYRVAALDNRFNISVWSEVVETELPDRVPPVAPTIQSIVVKQSKVYLRWMPSPSTDVVAYRVLRRRAGEQMWTLIERQLVNDSMRVADIPDKSGVYQYRVESEDGAGLTASTAIVKIDVKAFVPQGKPVLQAVVDRESKEIRLSWDRYNGAVKYLIYRSTENEAMALYATTGSSNKEFIDSKVNIGKKFTYWFKVVYANGIESEFSDSNQVNF
jgi:uncharacterized protein